ncbi:MULTISPECIES: peptide-binding protein [unclassified Methylophaga]|jgi:peptide/nickel transport system substrate-binding protein|uniref:peptide-binding protein n=1 Tax=unclassified Methylophaga TaxID=2629249 RepID=UPI0025E8A5DD|nr:MULTISPECIES: peptide-binding protein [unclassified Methylophaga]|tara:strand:- start:1304 stop:3184 length:1881 start_codon:yes stop_codon:yes gene_type:complete
MKNGNAGISKLWFWLGLSLFVVMFLLLMVQIDRQWTKMDEMTRIMEEQAKDIRSTRGLLRNLEKTIRTADFSSAANTSFSDQSVTKETDAFERARRATEHEEYAQGDWLMMAFGSNIRTLTPLVSADAYSAEVQQYVLESLLVRNPETLEWNGLLAEDWSTSADGLTITFALRRDISFSDGEPLTAKDVEFTFNFIMNEAIAAPRSRAYLSRIERVTALDDYHVEFVFKEPYFNSLQLAGSLEILPEHFYGRFLDDPQTFNESRGLLLGSGPFRLANPEGWSPDAGVVELVRNPRYWGPVSASFDRIVWRIIENDSARLTTFRNGDIDVYSARPREYQTLLDDKDIIERSQNFEYMSPTAGYSFIAWNQERGGEKTIFADKRVRIAMSMLTDVDRVLEEIFLGYGQPAASPFMPGSAQHDKANEAIGYNIEKARELLLEAGFQDSNNDGVLETPDGDNFEFSLTYFQDSDDTRRMVLFLRDLYARSGIIMKPNPTEWSVMVENIQQKNFDAITLAWTSGIEIDIYQMFHSSQTVEGGDNFINYRNPELDAIIDAARGEVNEEKRMNLWHQAEKILVQDQPYTFLFRRNTMAFIDRRIHNLEKTALGLNLMTVPVEIYVPAELQHSR